MKNKQNLLVGVDISSTSVKVIEIAVRDGNFSVEGYAIEPFPAGAVAERNITDLELTGKTIAKALRTARIKSKFAAASVSGSTLITKTIDVDKSLSENELEMQIIADAEQYIPYPLAEVNLDFDIIGPADGTPNKNSVLLVATRKEMVESRVDALEIAGLTAKVMDVDAYAVERACSLIINGLEGQPEVVAVMDIGHTSFTFMVLKADRVIYTREQAFGGLQLLEAIQRQYGITLQEAQQGLLKHTLPEDFREEILSPFLDLMVQHMGRSLQVFYSSSNYNDVDHILLLGGSANLPGFTQAVKNRLGNNVSIANPFVSMLTASNVNTQQLEADAASLVLACGLALRSFE